MTVALAVAGWIVGMTPSLFINHDAAAQEEPGLGVVLLVAAMAGAGAGLCFGAAQWFILRRHAERAGRWIGILFSEWRHLDVLVHNAGATFPQRTMTADGIEATLAVDVVGPLPTIRRSEDAGSSWRNWRVGLRS